MWKKLRPLLPHGAIVLANAYVVFFLIDRVNTSMNFIDNHLTKGLLLVMCALAIADWRIAKARTRRGKGASPRGAAASAKPGAAAPRPSSDRAQPKKGAGKHLAKPNPAERSGA